MNTPEPCCKCRWCRWNVLEEENPESEAWCEFGFTLGMKECPKFKDESE